MLENISPNLMPKDGAWYYKKHSDHAAFNEVVAEARSARLAKEAADAKVVYDGKIAEAEVKEDEVNEALLQDDLD